MSKPVSAPRQKPVMKCASVDAFENAGKTRDDFRELVHERSGEIVTGFVTGETSKPSKFEAVEVVAQSVARYVLDMSAASVANMVGVGIEELKRQAAGAHITSC